MIGTESRLWAVLNDAVAAVAPRAVFARIETGLVREGVADVEYVCAPWHGWIELKTASYPKPGRPIVLRHPLSYQQLIWLLNHEDHKHWLRSWVLIGIAGQRAWAKFILLPPNRCASLVEGRKPVPHENLMRGHVWVDTIDDVVQRIFKRS